MHLEITNKFRIIVDKYNKNIEINTELNTMLLVFFKLWRDIKFLSSVLQWASHN